MVEEEVWRLYRQDQRHLYPAVCMRVPNSGHVIIQKSCVLGMLKNFFCLFVERLWRKLNSAPVCFGTKNDQFGRFQVEFGGSFEAVKLVHLYGFVTCAKGLQNAWTKWGCGRIWQFIRIFKTDASNTILLPMGKSSRYIIPGYTSNSTEIVFNGFPLSRHLSSGQELRLWYDQDLFNSSEYNNGGKSCADIFAKYP